MYLLEVFYAYAQNRDDIHKSQCQHIMPQKKPQCLHKPSVT